MTGVSKSYALGTSTIHALNGLDLSIPHGDFAAIMGPSGSGKSTLLNLIGCIETPTSGAVEVLGRSTQSLSDAELTRLRRDEIGFIFQSFSLIPVLSAAENVEYPLILSRMPARERAERVAEMLAAVGLSDRAGHRPGELSGGQRQRVAIARALVKHPQLVVADEPTASVDRRTGQELLQMMLRIQEIVGSTFVVATHDPQVRSFARSCWNIVDGRIADQENL